MLSAILEAVSTLGPIVLFMLIPVLIPVFTLTAGAIFDRVKRPNDVKTPLE